MGTPTVLTPTHRVEPADTRPAASVRVRAWERGDADAWDAYVAAHPRSTFFHQCGWKRVLERAFSYPAHYLVATRDARICGVLPLFACRSIRGKRSLYSLPHTIYGGPLADDAGTEQALLDYARSVAASYDAVAVHYRNRFAPEVSLPPTEGFVTFEKELPEDPDEVYRSFPKKAREALNQARKRHRLECEFQSETGHFYDLLADSFQRLGTPVFPRRFFDAIREEFPDRTSILIVRHGRETVAGVMSVVWGDTLLALYSGEAPDVRHLKSANFKYCRLMEHAVRSGQRRFDFGRSRLDNQGAVQFKLHQGFEATPLPYSIDPMVPGVGGDASPNQGIFAKVRPAWTALPTRLARTLGPGIVRFFP